ncbi:MAG: helicase SNF2, partial [Azospira oryzae]
MVGAVAYKPGDLVKARGREWVVLPETRADLLKLRPLGGSEDDATLIYLPLEPEPPVAASFDLPDPGKPGSQASALLLRDALRLKLRAGAGPFRSFGNISVEPRAYQLVPLLMALKLDPVRLLIADDVGIGKTIEAGLIARELLDRGEVERLAVICPPHLCEQWQEELASKFNIESEVVRTGTATRLERGLRPDESIFEVYPFTVVSLDYIKSDRRRADFLRACPELVIVDEAHTCVQANTATRHQRYQLVKGLAEAVPARHMLFLTATPHSGDDTAFHHLLGLIAPRFASLIELPEGEQRRRLREELADHFVQRRRGDIAEWRDSAGFPVRESREATYKLTGNWGRLFDDVLDYARGMVKRSEGGTKLEQRMSWWAALALLRCVSSSPAAAALALRTRLKAVEDEPEGQQIAELDQAAAETVMDGAADDALTLDETVPAGTIESPEDAAVLRQLIERAEALRGVKSDPKLATLVREVQGLVGAGFKPVVFCRYIATAHYVAEHLKAALPTSKTPVIAVTGELTSDQREERIEALGNLDNGMTPILVATDCLSEGINLQRFFDAVVHYDLTWNPTRHEQREGRVDRFGQSAKLVRALMLYGENNPVDGAVLKVILRKAEKIRKELGVAVPLPADNTKVVDAIMRAVLLQSGKASKATPQLTLDFGETEAEVDAAWETARDRMTRTVFAQKRLRPDEVLPEWRRAVAVLGGEEDVSRFVRTAAERLGTPLEEREGYHRLPLSHLPKALQDRLEAIGLKGTVR